MLSGQLCAVIHHKCPESGEDGRRGRFRMVSTLIVQAHPLDESYNAALLQRVRAGVAASGELYTVRRIGSGELPEVGDVQGCRRLVLVYPTWWGGQPAMLLDWLQQMLRARAFGSVSRLQAATTHGSSHLVNLMQGEWGRRFLAERVAAACRPRTKLEWHALYKIDRRTPIECTDFLDRTEAFFAA